MPRARKLTHADPRGRVRQVDVGSKPRTAREAVAEGFVAASPAAVAALRAGRVAKGDPLQAARIAGIQAGKRTADLIPLCHPVPLTHLAVDLEVEDGGVRVTAAARARWHTGVEMEALTAVAAACLTVYDMLKAVDKAMVIEGVRLRRKRGGRSGDLDLP